MNTDTRTHRRGFLGRILGGAAAASLPFARLRAQGQQMADPDSWIKEVPGTHRTLFDFPRHNNFWPLLHVGNYLSTYAEAYKIGPGQVGAVGTLYGMGPASSIPLGFNDMIWSKYALGEYMGLKDAAGKPYTRNVFNKPTIEDAHLLFAPNGLPHIAGLAGFAPNIGIESLQKAGTKFILCNNALGGWILELETRGKGKADAIEKDLRANVLPGVTIVPAMVIAIEKAQEAGIRYNRQ